MLNSEQSLKIYLVKSLLKIVEHIYFIFKNKRIIPSELNRDGFKNKKRGGRLDEKMYFQYKTSIDLKFY